MVWFDGFSVLDRNMLSPSPYIEWSMSNSATHQTHHCPFERDRSCDAKWILVILYIHNVYQITTVCWMTQFCNSINGTILPSFYFSRVPISVRSCVYVSVRVCVCVSCVTRHNSKVHAACSGNLKIRRRSERSMQNNNVRVYTHICVTYSGRTAAAYQAKYH